MIGIDLEKGVVVVDDVNGIRTHPLGSAEAFAVISDVWLRAGWDSKYVYTFTWLGRPIIQLPDDIVRLQEVIYGLQPDVIIETGVAHGGSLILYASLCKAMDSGRVIGIDIEIRPHNRTSIESHALSSFITLIEGSSVDDEVVEQVKAHVRPGEKVLVLLDSDHSKAHVAAELAAYAPLVSPGSYIVAMDGIMGRIVGAPRTQPDWEWNNPCEAAIEFVAAHPEFECRAPEWLFNESKLTEEQDVTYWPGAWLRRKLSRVSDSQ